MPNLPSLLKKLEALHRQQIEIERAIAEVEREIIATRPEPTHRARRARPTPFAVDKVRELVAVLHAAGEPLLRREIAARLGSVSMPTVAGRLRVAMRMMLVERAGRGRYRCASAAAAVLS